ncbi:MAG: hypothetical protein KGI33_08960 [Thaumarchaeota archaeon]|nr:hypothetical protein [Nitrososphaerota archaeon]
MCLAFWAVSFLLDAAITVSRRELVRYESNLLFRYLVGRFGVRISVAIQATLEAGLGLAISSVISYEIQTTSVGIISLVFGTAHLLAWHSNRRFLAGYELGSGS